MATTDFGSSDVLHDRKSIVNFEHRKKHTKVVTWPHPKRGRTPGSPQSLERCLHSYLLDAEARQLTPKTLCFYREQLGPFLDYLDKHTVSLPDDIQAGHIRAYLVSLKQRGLKDNSIHAAARAIRAFCNFMVAEDIIADSPMHNVQMPRRSQEILPAFSCQEVKQLVETCRHARDRAIVLFLIDTGCRASELVGLNMGDVDIKESSVIIRQGKGRKDREVYMGMTVRRELVRYFRELESLEPWKPLWISLTTGQRLTTSGLRLVLRRLGQRAGVDHCHPHTFRRTCALWSLRAGMDIYRLQRLMGHTDLAMLRRYLALVSDDLREAHSQYGAVDNILE